MSILQQTSLYRVDQQDKTLVIACHQKASPELVYFGDALPKGTSLESVYLSQQAGIPQAMLDQPAAMSLIPEAGRGWLQSPAVEAQALDRPVWAMRK